MLKLNLVIALISFSLNGLSQPCRESVKISLYPAEGYLLVSVCDLEDKPTKYYAVKEVLKTQNYWRLPTKSELNFLKENRNKIGGFKDDYYLSNDGDKVYMGDDYAGVIKRGADWVQGSQQIGYTIFVRRIKN